MAKQEIKFKVTLKELSIEFEGTRDMGQALQTGLNRSLGNLLEMQRTATALPASLPPAPPTLFDADGSGDCQKNGHAAPPPPAAEKVRKPRKISGVSLTNLLREMKGQGFFGRPGPSRPSGIG